MSVPLSNTNLRVPRGFGTILEGLTLNVLRDQPGNIPEYAALYFNDLLHQREDSGIEPAEWAAKLEDRFYNNHVFKASREIESLENEPLENEPLEKESLEKEPLENEPLENEPLEKEPLEKESGTQETDSKEKPHEPQTEDDPRHSGGAPDLSTAQPKVPAGVDVTQGTPLDEEEKQDSPEKHIVLTEEEEVHRLQNADELSGPEEEREPQMNRLDQGDGASSGEDGSAVPHREEPPSEVESSDLLTFGGGVSDVDVCAQELGTAQEDGGDAPKSVDVDVDSSRRRGEGEEETDAEDTVEVPPYSGLADVDVCAMELLGTMERPAAKDDPDSTEEESLKLQTKEPDAPLSPSPSETPEDHRQESEDQSEKTTQEGTKTEPSSSGEINQSLPPEEVSSDSHVIPKEDSLVEISFEDVPEVPQVTEVEQRQPEVEDAGEVLQDDGAEMEQEERTSDATPAAAGSDELPQREWNNPGEKDDDVKDTVGGDEEDGPAGGDAEEEEDQEMNDSVTETLTSAMEAKNETFEPSEENLPQEREETPGARGDSQLEALRFDEDVPSVGGTSDTEGNKEEGGTGSEVLEKSASDGDNGSVSCSQSALRRPADQEPEGDSDKDDCSRPQDEEDIMDIPLDDPEANRAAAKIQAGFRGHMTRKKMKPEDKAEGEEVSSTGDVLSSNKGDPETGGSGAVERGDTSVPAQ